jgi:hypothetical protein
MLNKINRAIKLTKGLMLVAYYKQKMLQQAKQV